MQNMELVDQESQENIWMM